MRKSKTRKQAEPIVDSQNTAEMSYDELRQRYLQYAKELDMMGVVIKKKQKALEVANSHMLSLQNANTELRNSYDNANSALEFLKNDYQKTKDYVSIVTALNGHLEEADAVSRGRIEKLLKQIEEHKRTEHLLLNETHKAKGELLKYRRRYKALLNAMTPLAAAIIFLAGMVIWLMM